MREAHMVNRTPITNAGAQGGRGARMAKVEMACG